MNFETVLNTLRQGARLRTHSGRVTAGDVFVALPGVRGNGAQYIPDAVARGAAIVVHGPDAAAALPPGAAYVAVPDPTRALGLLARAACNTEQGLPRIIGVTGTNGKTTTAHLIHHLLGHNNSCVGLLGTVHCLWPGTCLPSALTTPDCLALHEMIGTMYADGVDTVVMEISSHALDQDRLAGLPVDIGLFTNLTQDHLDYHGDMETYFQAKERLFCGPHACARGAVNVDDPFGRRLRATRPDLLGFGLDAADAALSGRILASGPWGMDLEMRYQHQRWTLRTGLVGAYNASNLLAAQAAGLLLGLEPGQMDCLAASTGAPGRLQRVPNSRGLDIFVDYAHTPDALEKVSAALKSLGFAHLVILFGCGGDRDTTKRPLMGQAAARYADLVVLTSDNPRTENPEAILDQIEPGLREAREVLREADRRAAIGLAISRMAPGDALLVAGKGHEDYQIVGTQKHHFSDFEVVREYLA